MLCSSMNMKLGVMMEPRLRPMRSAMKPTLSMPNMMPAICEYVTESSSVLLHAVCLVQQVG